MASAQQVLFFLAIHTETSNWNLTTWRAYTWGGPWLKNSVWVLGVLPLQKKVCWDSYNHWQVQKPPLFSLSFSKKCLDQHSQCPSAFLRLPGPQGCFGILPQPSRHSSPPENLAVLQFIGFRQVYHRSQEFPCQDPVSFWTENQAQSASPLHLSVVLTD